MRGDPEVRIRARDLANELAHILVDSGSTWSSALALAALVVATAPLLPLEHGP
jgi:hypothetical protein